MPDRPIEFFIELESRVWDALVDGDRDAERALLSSDFVGVYPTGFADRSVHANQLVDGPTMASYSITDAKLVPVSDSTVLLCYRADFRRVRDGPPGSDETMYISSLWAERDGRWWNTFSQDTPAS
jgi:hypothetical protein